MRKRTITPLLFVTLLCCPVACKEADKPSPGPSEETSAKNMGPAKSDKPEAKVGAKEAVVPISAAVSDSAFPAVEPSIDQAVRFDLPILGGETAGFDVSLGILKASDPLNISLTAFGSKVKEGDKGLAKDWTSVCDTRLNAFPRSTQGFTVGVRKVDKASLKPGATFEASALRFTLQAGENRIENSDWAKHGRHEGEMRIVSVENDRAVVEIVLVEDGKDGSLRGRFAVHLCGLP